MENHWLMTLLLAPILAPTAGEAYSLYWYMLERDACAAASEDSMRFDGTLPKVELADEAEVRS